MGEGRRSALLLLLASAALAAGTLSHTSVAFFGLARAGDLRALGALAAEFRRTHGSVAAWAVAAAALLAPLRDRVPVPLPRHLLPGAGVDGGGGRGGGARRWGRPWQAQEESTIVSRVTRLEPEL